MKLTRKQLTHAKDYQLHAIGLTRHKSRGWLKAALEMEWTEEEIQRFAYATKGTQLAAEIRAKTNGMFHKPTDQQKEIDRLKAELAQIKVILADGHAVHLNMLRGTIATPTRAQLLHILGDQELCEADAEIKKRKALHESQQEKHNWPPV